MLDDTALYVTPVEPGLYPFAALLNLAWPGVSRWYSDELFS